MSEMNLDDDDDDDIP